MSDGYVFAKLWHPWYATGSEHCDQLIKNSQFHGSLNHIVRIWMAWVSSSNPIVCKGCVAGSECGIDVAIGTGNSFEIPVGVDIKNFSPCLRALLDHCSYLDVHSDNNLCFIKPESMSENLHCFGSVCSAWCAITGTDDEGFGEILSTNKWAESGVVPERVERNSVWHGSDVHRNDKIRAAGCRRGKVTKCNHCEHWARTSYLYLENFTEYDEVEESKYVQRSAVRVYSFDVRMCFGREQVGNHLSTCRHCS